MGGFSGIHSGTNLSTVLEISELCRSRPVCLLTGGVTGESLRKDAILLLFVLWRIRPLSPGLNYSLQLTLEGGGASRSNVHPKRVGDLHFIPVIRYISPPSNHQVMPLTSSDNHGGKTLMFEGFTP